MSWTLGLITGVLCLNVNAHADLAKPASDLGFAIHKDFARKIASVGGTEVKSYRSGQKILFRKGPFFQEAVIQNPSNNRGQYVVREVRFKDNFFDKDVLSSTLLEIPANEISAIVPAVTFEKTPGQVSSTIHIGQRVVVTIDGDKTAATILALTRDGHAKLEFADEVWAIVAGYMTWFPSSIIQPASK